MALGALVLCVPAALQPLRPVGAALFVVITGSLGHGLVAHATDALPRPARVGVALGAGSVLVGVAALVVADLGVFGPWALALGGLLLVAGVRAAATGDGRRISLRTVAVLAALGAAVATIPAYAFDLGGRDAGLYVLTSEQLQRTGSLHVESAPVVRDGLRRFGGSWLGATARAPFPGTYADGDAAVPHGYHLTPAAMAAGATVTGGGGQWVVTLAGAILVLLVGATASLLARPPDRRLAMVAAGVLLACDAALVYFSRYPMTEVPSGVMLLSAGVATALAVRGGDRRLMAVAGAAFGAAPLVRADTWPLMVVVPLAVALAGRGRRHGGIWLAAGFVPLLAYAAVRAMTTARGYTDDTVSQVLRGLDGTTVVAVLAAAVMAAAVAVVVGARRLGGGESGDRGPEAEQRGRGARARRRGSEVAGLLRRAAARRTAAAVVMVAALVLAVVPPTTGLEIFRTYATLPGLLLAGAGAAILVDGRVRLDARGTLPLLILGLIALALVAGKPQVVVADQYWTARRYLPVALPLVAVLAGVAVALAWRARVRRPYGPGAVLLGAALALATVAISLHDALPALSTTEFDGVPEQMDRIDRMLPGADALILGGPTVDAYAGVIPSLAMRSGRAAVALHIAPSLARGPARLDPPGFGAWLADQARRRPVYLVLANLGELAINRDPRILAVRATGRVELRVVQVDKRVGGPPRGSDVTRTPLTLVRILPASSSSS